MRSELGVCDIRTVDEWTSVLRLACKWSVASLRQVAFREIVRLIIVHAVILEGVFLWGQSVTGTYTSRSRLLTTFPKGSRRSSALLPVGPASTALQHWGLTTPSWYATAWSKAAAFAIHVAKLSTTVMQSY